MYELKRLAIEFGLTPKGVTAPVLSKLIVNIVDKYGRISETELVSKFYLKTNPFAMLNMIPRAMKMFLRGRLPMIPHKIRGASELKKCTDSMSEPGIAGLRPGLGAKEAS
jgi:hypothetical protein